MAEQRTPHLRVVRPSRPAAQAGTGSRDDYWAQVQALRDVRRRLRAG